MKNDEGRGDEPAFPFAHLALTLSDHPEAFEDHTPGMSVRTWLAGQALAGAHVVFNGDVPDEELRELARMKARWARMTADELLRELKETSHEG